MRSPEDGEGAVGGFVDPHLCLGEVGVVVANLSGHLAAAEDVAPRLGPAGDPDGDGILG